MAAMDDEGLKRAEDRLIPAQEQRRVGLGTAVVCSLLAAAAGPEGGPETKYGIRLVAACAPAESQPMRGREPEQAKARAQARPSLRSPRLLTGTRWRRGPSETTCIDHSALDRSANDCFLASRGRCIDVGSWPDSDLSLKAALRPFAEVIDLNERSFRIRDRMVRRIYL
jgi:hypothetical protein